MTIKQQLLESITEDKTIPQVTVGSILEGEDLTPEFKLKLEESFNAAVVERAKEEVSIISEAFESKFNVLDEMYESKFTKLDEEYKHQFEILESEAKSKKEYTEYVFEQKFAEYQKELNEAIESYLDYTATQYIKNNSISIHNGLKTEITEGFIAGLKTLFESNFIDIPDEKLDIVSEQDKTIDELKAKLNEAVDVSIQYKKELDNSLRANIVEEFTTKLTDTEAERFQSLSEELSFATPDLFRTKLSTIKEHYFNKTTAPKKVDSFISDTPVEQLKESYIDPTMSAYVDSISRYI